MHHSRLGRPGVSPEKFRSTMLSPELHRALICLRYGIGDVVMELPALRALRMALPETEITALGAFPAPQLLQREGLFDQVKTYSEWGFLHRWDKGCSGAAERFGAWLDHHHFDTWIDLHHAPTGLARQVWARGIPTIESDESAEAAVVRRGASGVEAIAAGVRAGWGIEVNQSAPAIALRPLERSFAQEFLRDRGVTAPPIGIGVVASLELKRWPLENVEQLIRELHAAGEGPFLIFAGPNTEVGHRIGEEGAYDHPEGITLLSEDGTAPVELLVYDSPHHRRIDGAGGVDADLFVIPG